MLASLILFASMVGAAQDPPVKPPVAAGQDPPAKPATPPTQVQQRAPKQSERGYEVYSWKNDKQEWCYVCLPTFEKPRTREQVVAPRTTLVGTDALKRQLYFLALEESVNWLQSYPAGKGPRFELPPEDVVADVKKFGSNFKLRIRVGKSEPEDAYKQQQAETAKQPVDPATPAIPPLKGFELYSWLGEGDTWRFALLEGTNRAKTHDEILAAEVKPGGPDELKVRLKKLASGAKIIWIATALKDGAKADPPPDAAVKMLQDYCKTIQADLSK